MSVTVTLSDIALPGRAGDPDFHLSTYQAGAGPAVVFVHGFPDLAIGWQHQLTAVAEQGFRVIAPDMRGYGGSSYPHSVEAYTLGELTGDLVALLDVLGIEKAVFVGHDWGGFVTWAMPVLHPDRVSGVAAACTPYMPFPSVEDYAHGTATGRGLRCCVCRWQVEYESFHGNRRGAFTGRALTRQGGLRALCCCVHSHGISRWDQLVPEY